MDAGFGFVGKQVSQALGSWGRLLDLDDE